MSPLGSFNVPLARGAADQSKLRFGEVINGKSIIRKIEGLKTQTDDKPVHEVSIIGRVLRQAAPIGSNLRLKIADSCPATTMQIQARR